VTDIGSCVDGETSHCRIKSERRLVMRILYTGVDIVAGDVMIVSRNNAVDKAIVSKAEAIAKVIRRIKGVNGTKGVDGIKTVSSIKAVIKSMAIDRALTVSGSRTVARAHERIEAVGSIKIVDSINAVDSIKAIEKAKAIHGSRDFLRTVRKTQNSTLDLQVLSWGTTQTARSSARILLGEHRRPTPTS
jgi:hypothetical protein